MSQQTELRPAEPPVRADPPAGNPAGDPAPVRPSTFQVFRNGVLAGATALAVKALLRSVRYDARGWERARLEAWHGGGVIFCFWHNNIMIPLGHDSRRRCQALMSLGADGEYAARVMRHFGVGAIRGSSTRGGAGLVKELLDIAGRGSILAVTPDGPRGPRYRVAPGACYLSSRTGLPLAPIGMALSRSWKLRSWDRFRIPKPFSRAVMAFGRPIHLPPDLDRDGLLAATSRLKDELDRLSREAALEVGVAWPD